MAHVLSFSRRRWLHHFDQRILWKKDETCLHLRVFISSSSLQNTFDLQISPYFFVTNFPMRCNLRIKKGNRWFSCTCCTEQSKPLASCISAAARGFSPAETWHTASLLRTEQQHRGMFLKQRKPQMKKEKSTLKSQIRIPARKHWHGQESQSHRRMKCNDQ